MIVQLFFQKGLCHRSTKACCSWDILQEALELKACHVNKSCTCPLPQSSSYLLVLQQAS